MSERDIRVRPMRVEEIERIGEVNREEKVEAVYVAEPSAEGMGLAMRLVAKDPPDEAPAWGDEGVTARARAWRPKLVEGGAMFGAFAGERLVAFAILGPKQWDSSVELVALFVDTDFRRDGLGERLLRQATAEALGRGATAMLLHSNETVSSMTFYLKHGFQLVQLGTRNIVRALGGGLVLAKRLAEVPERKTEGEPS